MTAEVVSTTGPALAPIRLARLDSCPACGHGPAAFAFASVDLVYDVDGVFVYERCPSCRSFFQNPRAVDEDLGRCYPPAYFTHDADAGPGLVGSAGGIQGALRRMVLRSRSAGPGDGRALDVSRWAGRLLSSVGFVRRRAMFGLVDEIRPPTKNDRCLEIGPGTGADMWRLSQLGWTVTGIDLDPEAAEVARARSGCQVVVGAILAHRPEEPYGLIYGSHSIEHVPNLRETIVHLRSLLGPGGRLVVIVPNAMSLSSRVFGPLSVVWEPPRHLTLPSVQALEVMLGDAGFSTVNVRTSPIRAAHYCAIARARRGGTTGSAAWAAPITRADRLLHAAEVLLVRIGRDVGEEIVVEATVA
jgi:2-polyprenyl-3-methyl-5-hydroxy-6-metoxy-1,4-benzoquinol methylase